MRRIKVDKKEATELAQAILEALQLDDKFMKSGRRNDDGVDFSIACHILGLDPMDMLESTMLSKLKPGGRSWIEAKNVIHRINPYLSKWGPAGMEWKAIFSLQRPYSFYKEDDRKESNNEQRSEHRR